MKKPIHLTCIVDDDEIYTYGLKKLLLYKDFSEKIIIFSNGQKAINFLAKVVDLPDEQPDILLLDINMPVMDGWQFLDEFLKIKPAFSHPITIFMLSSSVDERDINRARTYEEVYEYFIKPVRLDDLDRIMKEYHNNLTNK